MIRLREDNTAEDVFEVRASDCDRFYMAGIPFFFSVCQEIGGLHAASRGLSIEDLTNNERKTWVIVRNRILFDSLPKWGEELNVVTWPQESYHLYCPRVIRAYSKDGDRIFESMTHWVVMDVDRKRPVRPKDLDGRIGLPDKDKYFIDPNIGKITKFPDAVKIENLPVAHPDPGYYDIDYNRHVNNVIYTRWMISGIPEDFLNGFRPSMIDVAWLSQTYAHDKVYVETAFTSRTEDGADMVHRIMRKEENKEDTPIFEANSSWIRK